MSWTPPADAELVSNVPVWTPPADAELIGSVSNWKPNANDLRTDGTMKGAGYFGPLIRPDGDISTELSIGVESDGRETEIPSLVPTLTKEEIGHLLSGKKPTNVIIQKAVDHAKKRMAEGKSVWADSPLLSSPQTQSTPTSPAPLSSNHINHPAEIPSNVQYAASVLNRYQKQFGDRLPAEKVGVFNKAAEVYAPWSGYMEGGKELADYSKRARSQAYLDPLIENLDEAMVLQQAYGEENATAEFVKRLPFAGGQFKAMETGDLAISVKRVKAGIASQHDWLTIAKSMDEAEKSEDKSASKKVMDLIMQLPAFGVEFALTGGAYTAGRQALQRGATKALGKMAETTAGKLAVGTISRAGGVAAQTLANPQLIAQETAAKLVPEFNLKAEDGKIIEMAVEGDDPSFLKALAKGAGSAFVEIGSERAGAALGWAGKELAKLPAAARVAAMKAAVVNRLLKAGMPISRFQSVMKQAGWNGLVGELFEERVGDVARGATGIEKDYGTTGKLLTNDREGWEQLGIEAVAFSVPAGAHAVGRLGGTPLPKVPQVAQVEKLDRETKLELIRDRVIKGGAPSRAEAVELGIPKEQSNDITDRRLWFLRNQDKLFPPKPVEQPPVQPTQEEIPDAEQIEETGPDDEGGGAQPEFRPQARDTAVGGEGVRPSGREGVQVEVAPEGEVAAEPAQPVAEPEKPAPQPAPETKPAAGAPAELAAADVARLKKLADRYQSGGVTKERAEARAKRELTEQANHPLVLKATPGTTFTIDDYRGSRFKVLDDGALLETNTGRSMGTAAEVLSRYKESQVHFDKPAPASTLASAPAPETPVAPATESTAEPEPEVPLGKRDLNVYRHAEEKGYEPDDFHHFASQVHEGRRETYEARQKAKRDAHQGLHLSVADVQWIEEHGFDYASGKHVPGRRGQALANLDSFATEFVTAHPEVFGEYLTPDPSGHYGVIADNTKDISAAIWELMKEPTVRKGIHIDSPEVLEEAERLYEEANAGFDPAMFADLDQKVLADELYEATPGVNYNPVESPQESAPDTAAEPSAAEKRTGKAWEAAAQSRKALADLLGEMGRLGAVYDPKEEAKKQMRLARAVADVVAKHVVAGAHSFTVLVSELAKDFNKGMLRQIDPMLRAQWGVLSRKYKLPPAPDAGPDFGPNAEVTSAKNWIVDELRAGRMENVLPKSPAMSQIEMLDRAEAAFFADRDVGAKLVVRLMANPRAVDEVETAIVQIEYRRVYNLFGKSVDALAKARQGFAADAILNAETDVSSLSASLTAIEIVAAKIKRTWHSVGMALQIELAQDFSLAGMTKRAMAAKGGRALTDSESKKIAEQAARIAELEKQLAEQQQNDRLQGLITAIKPPAGAKPSSPKVLAKRLKLKLAKNAFFAAQSNAFKATEQFGGIPVPVKLISEGAKLLKAYVDLGIAVFEDIITDLRRDYGAALTEEHISALQEEWNNLTQSGEISSPLQTKADLSKPAAVGRLALKLLRSAVEAGITGVDAVVDHVHAHLLTLIPDFTRRQTMDAISGYGDYRRLDEGEIATQVRDIRGQLQQLAKLEDMAAGKAPLKTGVERRTPSDEERRLIQQVNEEKKRSGFTVTDPAKQLKSALDAAKKAVRNRIADLEQEIASREKIVKQRTPLKPDAELIGLRKQRDALQQVHEKIFPAPKMTDAQKVAAAEKALDRVIVQLEADIRGGKIGRKPKPERLTSPGLEAKRKRLNELRATREQMRDAIDPNYLYRKQLERQLAEYERRMREKDFEPPVRKDRKLDKATQEIKYQIREVKQQFEKMKEAWQRENWTRIQKAQHLVATTLDTSRAIITSIDLSAVLRQGGLAVAAHPKLAAKIIPAMMKAAAGKRGDFAAAENIRNRANAVLYAQAKLGITDSDAKLTEQEEAYAGNAVGYLSESKVPVLAQAAGLVKASERAYVTFLNLLRADMFDLLAADLSRTGEATLAEAKVIANYVNVITGRGPLGKVEVASKSLVHVFFAPKFVWSRFQFLAFQPLWRGSGRVRWLIAKEYVRILRGYAVFYGTIGLASAALWGSGDDDDDKPKITFDPRTSDFCKVRIGETVLDPLTGLSQTVVVLTRLMPFIGGETKSQRGQVRKMEADEKAGTALRFFRTKLSPWLGSVADISFGENVVGEKTTVPSVLGSMFIPLSLRDIYEGIKEHGVPTGTAIGLVTVFGMGANTYQRRSTGSRRADKVFEAWYAKNPRDETIFPGAPSNEYVSQGKTVKMTDKQFFAYQTAATEASRLALEDYGVVKLEPSKANASTVKWIRDIVLEARGCVRKRLVEEWDNGRPGNVNAREAAQEAVQRELGSLAWTICNIDSAKLSTDDDKAVAAKKAIAHAKALGIDRSVLTKALAEKLDKMGRKDDSIYVWKRRLKSRLD